MLALRTVTYCTENEETPILRPAESQSCDVAEADVVVEEKFDDGVLTRLKRETTVLHVDDDELIGSMVGRMLKKAGFPAHHYLHPKKALDDVCSGAIGYDLAVLDYAMPELDGLSLAKELLRLHPGKPVVITTGFISDDLRKNAPTIGVSELIPKPNTGAQLLKSIERLALQLARRIQVQVQHLFSATFVQCTESAWKLSRCKCCA